MSQEYIRQYKTISTDKQALDAILTEDGEDTLNKWYASHNNTSGAETIDTAKAYRGKSSILLDTGGTTPASGNYSQIEKNIGSISAKRIKMGMFQLFPSTRSSLQIEAYIRIIDPITGIYYKPGLLMYDDGINGYIAYRNSGGTYTTIETISYGFDGNNWYKLEIGVDILKEEYLYLIFGGKRYDLSGIKMEKPAIGTGESSRISVRLVTNSAAQRKTNIDDIVVAALEI